MTSKCLKLKWNGEWFFGKVLSIFNVISLKCRSLSSEKWLRVYLFFVCLFIFFFYNVVENRTQEIEDRKEKNLLFILSVLS